MVVGRHHETLNGMRDARAAYVYVYDAQAHRFELRGRYAPGVNGVPGKCPVRGGGDIGDGLRG